jgi:tetratricopeptide (TPR) repeat protein
MKTTNLLIQAACMGFLTLGAAGAAQSDGEAPRAAAAQIAQSRPESSPSESQLRLLDLAMQAATRIPIEPHVKDRSRAQEEVVAAYLSLNDVDRARECIVKIADWRRGAAYADLAFHLAQQGQAQDVEHELALAAGVAHSVDDWRRDRINIKIARARALMGQSQRAQQLANSVEESQRGRLDEALALVSDAAKFDQQLEALAAAANDRNFDLTRSALDAVAQLFNRFYSDVEKRERAERQIKSAWGSVPEMARIDVYVKLTNFALAHNDQKKSLQLVSEAQALLESVQWTPDYRIATTARLAGLRYQSGDAMVAKRDISAAMAQFETDREMIIGIDRAAVWRAIAESHKAMDDDAAALESYRKAVELGADNPNGRPRALDLSATCRSMALSNVEPDSELWARFEKIREGLSHPW